jgi:ketosteroid isomerase-like protein
MPKRSTVEAFAATVESNKHVDAILNFYAPDARTQENNNPPRIGRDFLAERERQVLASVAGVETTRLSPIFVEGDHSAICWRFAFTGKDGKVRTMEEVAVQTWRGEELIEERFFYDPRQMAEAK